MSKKLNTIIGQLGTEDSATYETYRVYNTGNNYTARLQSRSSIDGEVDMLITDINGIRLGYVTDPSYVFPELEQYNNNTIGFRYKDLDVVYTMGEIGAYKSPYFLMNIQNTDELFVTHPSLLYNIWDPIDSTLFSWVENFDNFNIKNQPIHPIFSNFNATSGGIISDSSTDFDTNYWWNYGIALSYGVDTTYWIEFDWFCGNTLCVASHNVLDYGSISESNADELYFTTYGKWDKFQRSTLELTDINIYRAVRMDYDISKPPFPRYQENFYELNINIQEASQNGAEFGPIGFYNWMSHTEDFNLVFFGKHDNVGFSGIPMYNNSQAIYEASVYTTPTGDTSDSGDIFKSVYGVNDALDEYLRTNWIINKFPLTNIYGDVLEHTDEGYNTAGNEWIPFIYHHHLFPATKHTSFNIGEINSEECGLFDVVTKKFYPAGIGVNVIGVPVMDEFAESFLDSFQSFESLLTNPMLFEDLGLSRSLDDNYVLMTGERILITEQNYE